MAVLSAARIADSAKARFGEPAAILGVGSLEVVFREAEDPLGIGVDYSVRAWTADATQAVFAALTPSPKRGDIISIRGRDYEIAGIDDRFDAMVSMRLRRSEV